MKSDYEIMFVFESRLVWQYFHRKDFIICVTGPSTDVFVNLIRNRFETALMLSALIPLINTGFDGVVFWGTCVFVSPDEILAAISQVTDIYN